MMSRGLTDVVLREEEVAFVAASDVGLGAVGVAEPGGIETNVCQPVAVGAELVKVNNRTKVRRPKPVEGVEPKGAETVAAHSSSSSLPPKVSRPNLRQSLSEQVEGAGDVVVVVGVATDGGAVHEVVARHSSSSRNRKPRRCRKTRRPHPPTRGHRS